MIAMNDFAAEPKECRDAMVRAVSRVLASGWFILGDEVRNFERRWAEVCDVRFAVGVANGMDAIEIALRAMGVGPGDEVVTTAMTAFASVLAIIRSGATPVLADIDADTGLLDPASVRRCLSARTRVVLLVHLYGQVRKMDEWERLCEQNGIALVEDCAQSHLATWRGHVAGSFGIAGAYSFYPTKNLGAAGDAGALVTNDPDIADKAACLRNYGQTQRYHHPELGLNSRLDELHAAMLSERLIWLEQFTNRRREIVSLFREGMMNPRVRLLSAPEEESAHVHHLFVVTCERREALQQHLTASGVQSLIHYPVPIHHQKRCIDLRRDSDGLLRAEAHAATCLSLPCHPQLADNDVSRIVDVVNAF